MEVPADLPQSLYFGQRYDDFRAKIRYFLKAQVVPVSFELVCDEYGKSKLRDRQRVSISPKQPIVYDP